MLSFGLKCFIVHSGALEPTDVGSKRPASEYYTDVKVRQKLQQKAIKLQDDAENMKHTIERLDAVVEEKIQEVKKAHETATEQVNEANTKCANKIASESKKHKTEINRM